MERTKIQDLQHMEHLILQTLFQASLKDENGEEITLGEYHFKFSNAVRIAGQCRPGEKLIKLSRRLCEANLHQWDKIKAILLHEMAHAFTAKIYGMKHAGHTPKFRKVARQLGTPVTGSQTPKGFNLEVPYKYKLTCPNCGKVTKYNQRVDRSCGKCNPGKYDPRYKMEISQIH